MILNRQEFAEWWDRQFPGKGLGDPDSVLWVPEQTLSGDVKMNWFLEISPIQFEMETFWNWCTENLQGRVLCYSSSARSGEWWGFECAEDIPYWILKWMKQ